MRYWEFERITGQKEHRTPFIDLDDAHKFINGLLAPFGLNLGNMVEIWGTPGIATVEDYHFVDDIPGLAQHSIAHLYSSILLDSDIFFDGQIIGLAVDRGPDIVLDRGQKDKWFAGCVVRKGEVEIFPVESPGPLYFEARWRFQMREGSLMALASATDATTSSSRQAYLDSFDFSGPEALVQAQEAMERLLAEVKVNGHTADPRFSADENFVSAAMKEVQGISVMLMERNIERIIERYGVDPRESYLALSGGSALNCPTNSHLMEMFGFKGILAPPCVGDAGQSLGMALGAFRKKLGRARFDFSFPGPYLGRDDDDLEGAVKENEEFISEVTELDAELFVDDILRGPVVWFNGRSEAGPRALGNRSILADPSSRLAKESLNDLKRREWWRPVAPIVIEEKVAEWFENGRISPHMLETFTVLPDQRDRIPAVAHLDNSARVQTVSAQQNELIYSLLTAVERRIGIPMLCNTSLNDKGEPIIDTIREAMNFCLRRGVSVGYFNGRRVAFKNHAAYDLKDPYPRDNELFSNVPGNRADNVRREHNPHGLSDVEVFLYLKDLELAYTFDIRTTEGAKAVRERIAGMAQDDPDLLERARGSMGRGLRYFTQYGGGA
ncbi:hypothetical protein BOQ63_002165 (plasmid) [Streptomyces viridifaciens]|nr:hypothetical protein BOQ63_002165 [Streptomyces viridifaciens]